MPRNYRCKTRILCQLQFSVSDKRTQKILSELLILECIGVTSRVNLIYQDADRRNATHIFRTSLGTVSRKIESKFKY